MQAAAAPIRRYAAAPFFLKNFCPFRRRLFVYRAAKGATMLSETTVSGKNSRRHAG
jgi:hypothetical protein